MTASAEGRAPGERVKLTVSERSISTLAARLEGWLAARLTEADQAAGSGGGSSGGGAGAVKIGRASCRERV